ncbi:MAG: response regulator transcription factor [Spirochaetota bacterium]
MNGTAIQVGLVDDHQVLRDGLKSIIEEAQPPMEVALEASSAREALDKLAHTEVRILLTDISMHGMDGIELARQIKQVEPRVRVIVLSMYHDAELIERAIKAGVWGYLLKENAAGQVVEAIEAVHRGSTYFKSGIPEDIVSEYRYAGSDDSKIDTVLTPRQTEILELICDGLTEREIAESLGISHHTVHVHKNNIMQTLHLHSKVDLVKYAVQHNLVQV